MIFYDYRTFLKDYRKSLHLSKRYVCKTARISYNTLTNLENGNTKEPRISVLESLAYTYGITMADIFNGYVEKRK